MTRARLLLAACSVALVALAAQAPAASAVTVNCDQKSYTYLWWPHGHAAIPSVKFPAYPIPHMEFYKPGSTYPNSNSLGYADARGGGGFSSKCRKVSHGTVDSRIPKSATATAQTALKCSFPRSPRMDLARRAGGGLLFSVFLGSKLVTQGKIVNAGARLIYDTAYCHKSPPPH
jgi:hypothetical protein